MALHLVVLMMMLMVVVVDCRNIAAAAAAAGAARDVYHAVNDVVFVRVARVTAGSGTVGHMVAHVVSILALGKERAMIVMHSLIDADIYSRDVWHIVHFIRGP